MLVPAVDGCSAANYAPPLPVRSSGGMRAIGIFSTTNGMGRSSGLYTGDKAERFAILVLPVEKWVARFGSLPDLPPHAFHN